ncbi:hypothetical protein JXA85_03630, partial [Candidatus Woesearchaeota archaeon]|nr:hypothetical protein [Candidatus Woesearchaeota archaeon]
MKIKKSLFILLFVLVLGTGIAVAATPKVGYIYYKSTKIDLDIIVQLQSMGFEVEQVKSTDIPTTDLSKYLFLFINNEDFPNEGNIPVHSYPSLIMDQTSGDLYTWGFAGYSSYSISTYPLKAYINDTSGPITNGMPNQVQVYTQAKDGNGQSLKMYYLYRGTKATGVLTNVSRDAYYIKDTVLGTVLPGTALKYGKTANARMAYFGIIATPYWTDYSKALFRNTAKWLMHDNTAPVISELKNTSISETTAVVSWKTDDFTNATLSYGTNSNATGTVLTEALPFNTDHSFDISGLEQGTPYYYKVKSCGLNGLCAESAIASFMTLDFTEPSVSNLTKEHAPGNSTASFKWKTDDYSTSVLKIWETGGIVFTRTDSVLVKEHKLDIVLDPLTLYYYNVTSCNYFGLCTTTQTENFMMTMGFDFVAPTINSVEHTGFLFDKHHRIEDIGFNITASYSDDVALAISDWDLLDSGNDSVLIGRPFRPYLNYETSDTWKFGFDDALPDGEYYVKLRVEDQNHNNVSTTIGPITVYNGVDITYPQLTGLNVNGITNQSAVVSWGTDDPANATVYYRVKGDSYQNAYDAAYVTAHSVTLNSLLDRIDYELYVKSCNNDGLCSTSSIIEFTTLPSPDSTGPAITLVSPENGRISTTDDVEFRYSADDYNDIVDCSLVMNNAIVQTASAISKNAEYSFTQGLPEVKNTWQINCTDSLGNKATSDVRNIERAVAPAITDIVFSKTPIYEGDEFNVSFTASDENNDITEYRIYADDVLVSTNNKATLQYSFEEAGDHSFRVYVKDSFEMIDEETGTISVLNKENIVVNEFGTRIVNSPPYTFAGYPALLKEDGVFDGYFVIGDSSPPEDVITLTNIIAQFQSEQPEIPIPVSAMKLASEIPSSYTQDMIVLGYPCDNQVIGELLGLANCNDFDVDGGLLKLFNVNGHAVVVVSGSNATNRALAGNVLVNYEDYSQSLYGTQIIIKDNGSGQPEIVSVSGENMPSKIELYNPTGSTVALNGWHLVAESTTKMFNTTHSIPSKGYLVVELTELMDESNGIIELYDNNDLLVDSVEYGDYSAPTPPFNKSVGRILDALDSDDDANDFIVLPRPTFGFENNHTTDEDSDGYDFTVDCDDANALANPGMPETYYNGIDDDCNASTIDNDQDSDGSVYGA